tara:strand:- start:94 stop:468 length:375 start_codon:yes stop_codon:yes gene_type:complete
MRKLSYLFATLLIAFTFSCEKEEETNNDCCANNDAMQMRMAMQQDGYTEIEVDPIEKIDCYFEQWDKTIMTPVSGLLEYYDQNNIWVASINFGDGTCDQWATKTWDINIFPDSPEGMSEFSLFE